VNVEVLHQPLQHIRHFVLQRLQLRLALLVAAELRHDQEAIHLGLLLLLLLPLLLLGLARAPARAAGDACCAE
jgi:hypothetical protein